MNQQSFNSIIAKFLQSPPPENKQNISIFNSQFDNLEILVKNAGGLYLTPNEISKSGHPTKIRNLESFYVVKGYNILNDEIVIWLGKII